MIGNLLLFNPYTSADSMLVHHLQHWINIETTLGRMIV